MVLKSVFHEGLHVDLKLASMYKYERVSENNDFKTEVRKLEAELSTGATGTTKCAAAVNAQSPGESEMKEVKIMLQQLQAQIGKIEKQQEEMRQNAQQQPPPSGNTIKPGLQMRGFRGQRHFRGTLSRDVPHQNNGRGNFRPQRSVATNTFRPNLNTVRCYNCDQTGHMARDFL